MEHPVSLSFVADRDYGPAATSQQLLAFLDQAITLTRDLGPELRNFCEGLGALSQRFSEERFHLAVLGQFKRGKSTLLNALLGQPLLPTSVVPLTAIPTFLRPGPQLQARVAFKDERPSEEFTCRHAPEMSAFLARYVSEDQNPRNRLGVAQVEVFLPAPILERGVVLIDTPGIGSTFRHNTEATLNFLPQCDAALFVVSADPPITEVEIEFLREVRAKVARIFFVLNKVDYLSQAEREQAAAFFKAVLHEQLEFPEDVSLFCLSARQGLEAALGHDAGMWEASGFKSITAYLMDFLAEGKASVLREAIARKAADLVAGVLMRLDLEVRALVMPLAELEERQQIFEQRLVDIRQQQQMAGDLLAGDRKRMHQFLEDKAAALRGRAMAALEKVLDEALAVVKGSDYHLPAQEALDNQVPTFFERELGLFIQEVDQKVTEVLRPHELRATELIASVRQTAAELFDVPYHSPESEGAFIVKRKPYWVTAKWLVSISPTPPIHLDWLFPHSMRMARVRKRLLAQIEELAGRNVENIRWATLQNLDRTFLLFGSALKQRLEDTVAATYGAIEAVGRRRQEHAGEVEGEVARLKSSAASLRILEVKLASLAIT